MNNVRMYQSKPRTKLPQVVNGLFIGLTATNKLKSGANGKVHSTFDRVINILLDGQLIGVCRSDVPKSPMNIITNVNYPKTMSSFGVKKGMPVWAFDNRIRVGETLEISLKNAKLWQAKTQAGQYLSLEVIEHNLDVARKLAARASMNEGLGQLLMHTRDIAAGRMVPTSNLNATAKTALPWLIKLVKATKTSNVEKVEAAAQKLIGLGQGLSPSADDTLSGFMVAIWWVSHSLDKNIDFVKVINQTIAKCSDRTTLLSQQMLRCAANGETNEIVERLLEAIFNGNPYYVRIEANEVLNIGETSGMDLLLGLLLGLESSLDTG